MKRVLLALSLLLCSVAANAQSPDGSIVLPFNLNPIGSLGTVTNGVSTNFGIVTLAPQTSPSGDYFALVNGNFSNGGGKEIAVLNGGQLYALTACGSWVQFNGSNWSSVSAPVAPDQTMNTAASGLPLVSPIGVWGFGKDALTGGNEIQLNGLAQGLAATTLENLGGFVYAKNASGNWFQQGGWIPTADPNSYAVPTTLTAEYLSANFHSSFGDNFASLSTICPNRTFSSTCKWFNGVEQCCMSPTAQPGNVGGAMFPRRVGPNGPVNPYSIGADGSLNITLSTVTNPNFTTVFSGVMTSIAGNKQGFLQQYGYFEVTMQVSPNVGTWPAFWMLSPSRNMEIDIVEQYGHDPNHYWGTVHDWGNGALDGPTSFPSTTVNLSTGYHQYGLLWDAGHISFYLDRQLMASYATPQDAKQPMYLLLDQGCGGGWPTLAGPAQLAAYTPQPPPPTAQLNGAVLAVQSVNVWQHN
jgi:Glycosyl hydrolases family 16